MNSLTPAYLDKLQFSAADGSMLKALGPCALLWVMDWIAGLPEEASNRRQ